MPRTFHLALLDKIFSGGSNDISKDEIALGKRNREILCQITNILCGQETEKCHRAERRTFSHRAILSLCETFFLEVELCSRILKKTKCSIQIKTYRFTSDI